MGVCVKALLNKKVSERDVYEFVKNSIALENDAELRISNLDDIKNNEYGNLYGHVYVLAQNMDGLKRYRDIFFYQSNGYDYKDINGGSECLGLSLHCDDEGQNIIKKIVEYFGGYYIANDCADCEKDGYAVYYRENFEYLSINKQNSLESKLWDAITSDNKYKPLLNNFGILKSLLKENPSLTNKEFNEGDLVYHMGLKQIGKFESWDIDDNTVNVIFEDDGYEDCKRVSASALKKLI